MRVSSEGPHRDMDSSVVVSLCELTIGLHRSSVPKRYTCVVKRLLCTKGMSIEKSIERVGDKGKGDE